MNLHKFTKDIYDFFTECCEEAKEMGQELHALDPFLEEFERDSSVLNPTGSDYLVGSNNRIDIFLTEEDEVVYAAYSPKSAAFHEEIQNSHSSLVKLLAKDHDLKYSYRWCGFYQRLMGNSTDILVLYGQSSDYPHNDYSEYVVRKFADKILHGTWSPDKVYIIDGDNVVIVDKDATSKDNKKPDLIDYLNF